MITDHLKMYEGVRGGRVQHLESGHNSSSLSVRSRHGGGGFYLFIHYSRATYLDHGGHMCSPFPVRCPRSGGSLQAPLFALRPGWWLW